MLIIDKEKNIERSFIIGDEWLYYKIYTGFKTSDYLIKTRLKPIVEELLSKNIIDKWFFIRYNDPEYHIRLRFHLMDNSKFNDLIFLFHQTIKYFNNESIIWKIQIDTYNREIERYGKNTIELSELLFYYDSIAIFNLIDLINEEENNKIRWQISIKLIDSFLDSFKFTDIQKKELLNYMHSNFLQEFGFDKESKKFLGEKFRKNKEDIYFALKNEFNEEINSIIKTKQKNIEKIVEQILNLKNNKNLEIDFYSLLSSYIHMTMNRLFRSNQRKYELVIYDFLNMVYTSNYARANKQKVMEI